MSNLLCYVNSSTKARPPTHKLGYKHNRQEDVSWAIHRESRLRARHSMLFVSLMP
jgi:hypothetical protein